MNGYQSIEARIIKLANHMQSLEGGSTDIVVNEDRTDFTLNADVNPLQQQQQSLMLIRVDEQAECANYRINTGRL